MKPDKDYFDSIAENWDTIRQQFFTDTIRNRLLEHAMLTELHIVADIGAGTGYVSEVFSPGARSVIGIDFSKEMLLQANKKLSILASVGEMKELPLKSRSVDRVLGNMILHHAADPGSVVSEMTRVLKPDGLLLISDMFSHTYEFLCEEQHDLWLGFDGKKIMRWFAAAGLDQITVKPVGEQCQARSEKTGEQCAIDVFIAVGSVPG